ncbi:MAG: hypothetical protein AAB227_05775 [Pseudomonadota bacterium]
MNKFLAAIVASVMLTAPAHAANEGGYLYRIETVRAAPGKLEALLDFGAEAKKTGYYEEAGSHFPFVMRHSQGDQWDVLVIFPMESFEAFHSKSRVKKRDAASKAHRDLFSRLKGAIAFEEDLYAYGPPLEDLQRAYAENGLFHIEMFAAAPGKESDLFEQRRMENAYLTATGQRANMIFRRAAGSDFDVFTIGFHPSLEAFAAPAPVSDEEKEAAAKAAGFKNRADISFYLRSLISSHHDTLATKVE